MPLPAELCVRPARCRAGIILPLFPADQARRLMAGGVLSPRQHGHLYRGAASFLPVGAMLGSLDDTSLPVFQVVGQVFVPGITLPCPLIRSLTDWMSPNAGTPEDGDAELFRTLPLSRRGYALACVTLSDKGFAGQREDLSGPAMADQIKPILPLCHVQRFLLPDDPVLLRRLVLELAVGQGYDLILSSGGTGLAPRDQTPEALLPILTRRLPGFEQQMMQASLAITPRAVISRALAGVVEECLILALPGSVKAAIENLNAVAPALPHALAKLKGDPGDCGETAI